MEKDKRLMEASLWDSMTEGETESCSDGWGHGNKSLIQFSDGPGWVPSLLFDLRPNYGGGNEDNVYLLQNVPGRHCYTQCSQPWSRPPMTHTSVGDSWTLMGKSGSFSCGVIVPSSWVLVHTRFCLCPLRSVSQSCESPGGSMVGLMVTSSKRAYTIPRSTAPRAPAPVAVHCWPVPPQEILKHRSVSVTVGSLGPAVHKACLSPLSISGRYGAWF